MSEMLKPLVIKIPAHMDGRFISGFAKDVEGVVWPTCPLCRGDKGVSIHMVKNDYENRMKIIKFSCPNCQNNDAEVKLSIRKAPHDFITVLLCMGEVLTDKMVIQKKIGGQKTVMLGRAPGMEWSDWKDIASYDNQHDCDIAYEVLCNTCHTGWIQYQQVKKSVFVIKKEVWL